MKNRWVTDSDLDTWFQEQMAGMDEWGGQGTAVDALLNDSTEHVMSLHSEDLKAIDVYENLKGGIDFGQEAERLNLKIFHFHYRSINIYILAKNKIRFKKLVVKAFDDWMAICEPLGEPEPPREDVIESLLRDIYTYIQDPKGRGDIESNWCERIEKLGLGK